MNKLSVKETQKMPVILNIGSFVLASKILFGSDKKTHYIYTITNELKSCNFLLFLKQLQLQES